MNQEEPRSSLARTWPPRGPVWIYRGAGWVEGQLIEVINGGVSAIVFYAKAGTRNPTNQMAYDPRNVRKEKPKKGENYLLDWVSVQPERGTSEAPPDQAPIQQGYL